MPTPAAHWYAVYTKPRQEAVALQNLERQGFRCLLPRAVNPYQRLSTRRAPRVEPLFPRYLFLNAVCEVQNMATVRSTRGVVGLVRAGFELLRVPPGIIRALQARQDPATGLVRLEPVPAQPGDRVRVFDGPLAGVEGIFEARTGEQRARVLMELLGRATAVEVDSLLLQRAG